MTNLKIQTDASSVANTLFILGCLHVEKPVGIGISVLGDEILIKTANFSACVKRSDVAGPSANCCGVIVRKRIFINMCLTVVVRLPLSVLAFAKKDYIVI